MIVADETAGVTAAKTVGVAAEAAAVVAALEDMFVAAAVFDDDVNGFIGAVSCIADW